MNISNVIGQSWSNAQTQAETLAQGASISGIAIAMTVFSIIGTILIGLSVLPQTIKTIRDHQTQQINILMYVFLVIGCAGLGIYGIGLVVVGNNIASEYLSHANLSYLLPASAGAVGATAAGALSNFTGPTGHFISPDTYHNLVINYIVPGAMLIFGEFFASITSAIVLYYKMANRMVAKKHNTTEDEICGGFAKNHPHRLLPVFHFKHHHEGGNK